MPKQKTTKRPALPAPQNLNEAAEYVRRIGEVKRGIEQADNEMNARIEAVKALFVERVSSLQEQLQQLVDGLHAFAQANRDELTDRERRKSVQLPTGMFGWRLTPKAVTLRGVKAVLERLVALGLDRFIRTKPEINKEAMLQEEEVAAGVEGVTIGQREEFFVKPSEAKAEIAVPSGKRVLKLAFPASGA